MIGSSGILKSELIENWLSILTVKPFPENFIFFIRQLPELIRLDKLPSFAIMLISLRYYCAGYGITK